MERDRPPASAPRPTHWPTVLGSGGGGHAMAPWRCVPPTPHPEPSIPTRECGVPGLASTSSSLWKRLRASGGAQAVQWRGFSGPLRTQVSPLQTLKKPAGTPPFSPCALADHPGTAGHWWAAGQRGGREARPWRHPWEQGHSRQASPSPGEWWEVWDGPGQDVAETPASQSPCRDGV